MAEAECPMRNGHCGAIVNSNDHCVSGKIFQTARQIFVHTGNLTNWSRSPAKVVKTATDEICENVIKAVNSNAPAEDKKLSEQKCVRFANKGLIEKIKNEERNKLKVSVKIFLNEENPYELQAAVFREMTELAVDHIDVVILSIPPFINPNNEFHKILLMWQELEKLVEQEYVCGLAICDFEKPALEKLCKTAKIKPIINQFNLASCCMMPKDLVEYAEQEGIQLLTHSDPKDIVPSEKLLEKINQAYDFQEKVDDWRYSWVTCHSVIIRCRTILQNRGYIVNLVHGV